MRAVDSDNIHIEVWDGEPVIHLLQVASFDDKAAGPFSSTHLTKEDTAKELSPVRNRFSTILALFETGIAIYFFVAYF